jgi:small subunit ribosomal protein S18
MSSQTDTRPRSLRPEEIPFTSPQMMSRYITDTGKILPSKYTGLSSKQQRNVSKKIKRARNMLVMQ